MVRMFLRAALAVTVCVILSALAWAALLVATFQDVISPGDPAFSQLLNPMVAGYFGDGTLLLTMDSR